MTIKDDLKSAIDARNTISFRCKDDFYRELEPHHYGQRVMNVQFKFLKKTLSDAVFGYQIAGGSKSNSDKGKPIEFREFKLDEIKDFKINKENFFEVRDKYDPSDRRWKIEYGVANSPNYSPK